ncbi:hypothetical protein Ddc_10903 [Ditylenchus destructor]|nr:hypothetical protein Ddc_10903 [Ditylenchus destructor]
MSEWRRQFLPGVTKRTVIRHYLPLSGAVSHSLFTVHLFSPSILARLFPIYDVAMSNAFLINSHLGIGFYLFFRPHLHHLNAYNRVEYSVFSSVMFNFGSLLFAVLLKPFLPERLRTCGRSIVGIALSFFMLRCGYKYLRHIDLRTKTLKDFRFEHANGA